MSNVTYAIVFKGEIIDGFQPISVKAHMAKLLKAGPDKMQALFSGKQVVIKRTADKAEAAKYGKALKKIGADVAVRVVKADAQKEAPVQKQVESASSSEPANTPAAVDTSGISLAPNEGNIVEAQPEAPPPDIDLSGISLAENDGAPLVEPSEEVHAELDLSEFSLKENDGSDLVEHPDTEVPEVEVPDFGLDEPGAVLETLKEEKEILNPNTMGITLAMAGSDLLEPEERDKAPPPKAPDTSGINLVPNFD